MTSPEEFLAALDHVVADYETSDDAMRWLPEPDPEPRFQPSLDALTGERMRAASFVLSRQEEWWVERSRQLAERRAETDPWPEVGHVTVEWRNQWGPEPVIDTEVWAAANPSMVGAARMVSTSTAVQGASPTRMVMDELAAFIGRIAEPLQVARREIEALERRTATTDPDKPGRVIALRHGVVAQHSPYGPKPRSRDGRMQGDDARRARLSPTGRPRRSRAHLGDRDRT